MLDELEALLALVDVHPHDRLVLLGDLINKGPDSAGVVSLLRARRDRGHDVVLVMGNHEEKLLRYHRRRLSAASGSVVASQATLDNLILSLGDANLRFLKSAVLWHRLHAAGALAVHAGIPPNIASLPSPEEMPALSHRQQLHSQQLLRVRRVNSHGNMVKLENATPADPFWASIYDNRFGHVYFGHHAFADDSGPRRFPHATGLDLGAVYGNRLAAVVLEPGRDAEFVTVAAARAHAIWNRWAE